MLYTYIQTKIIFFIITRVSELTKLDTTFLGLTLICWGGCVGDLMTASVAVKHKASNFLITSIIGSQVINLHICLGVPWTFAIIKSYVSYGDESFRLLFEATDIVNYLIPAVCLVILSTLIIALSNFNLNKRAGYLLIVVYICYLIYEFKIK